MGFISSLLSKAAADVLKIETTVDRKYKNAIATATNIVVKATPLIQKMAVSANGALSVITNTSADGVFNAIASEMPGVPIIENTVLGVINKVAPTIKAVASDPEYLQNEQVMAISHITVVLTNSEKKFNLICGDVIDFLEKEALTTAK